MTQSFETFQKDISDLLLAVAVLDVQFETDCADEETLALLRSCFGNLRESLRRYAIGVFEEKEKEYTELTYDN